MSINHDDVLAAAVNEALRAPSVLNTQPWRWRREPDSLELYADRDRQLAIADAEGRLLLLSCGAALHHARVALAAAGWSAEVDRTAETSSSELLARVRLVQPREPSPEDRARCEAIGRRRTDRRPYLDRPVADELVAELQRAAEAEGAHLYHVRLSQMPMLASAAGQAGETEMSDPGYRNELMHWVNRPEWSGDGVPVETTTQHGPRRVPQRELALPPQDGVPIEAGGDQGAVFLILYGDTDAPDDWLRAGEALSAVMLTAVTLGLSTAPMSDLIEVEHCRDLVRGLLSGPGCPYLVLRCGYGLPVEELAEAPRRITIGAVAHPATSLPTA